MKIVPMYEAEDGKQFRDAPQCIEYEQQCSDLAAANDMMDNGATLMAALTRAHQTRPWWDQRLALADKAILMKTTKDTGFVVSHWQCINKPVYKPTRLDRAGRVQLFGDAGSWSGPYGNWVELTDLLLYARASAQ